MTDDNTSQDMVQKIQELENLVGDMRIAIEARRTMLSNADKTLQQFQDSIYAALMEDEHSIRTTTQKDDIDV